MNFSKIIIRVSKCAISIKFVMMSATLSSIAFGGIAAPVDWSLFETKHVKIEKGISKWSVEIPFSNLSQSIWDIKMKDIPEQLSERCVVDTDGGGQDCTNWKSKRKNIDANSDIECTKSVYVEDTSCSIRVKTKDLSKELVLAKFLSIENLSNTPKTAEVITEFGSYDFSQAGIGKDKSVHTRIHIDYNRLISEKLSRYFPANLKSTSEINSFRRTIASLHVEGFNLEYIDTIEYMLNTKNVPLNDYILACSFTGDLGPDILYNFPNHQIELDLDDSNGEIELLVNPLAKYFSILPGTIWIERLMDKKWRLILNAAQ